MSETVREVIVFFDSITAILLFGPAMVAIAIWHEVRHDALLVPAMAVTVW